MNQISKWFRGKITFKISESLIQEILLLNYFAALCPGYAEIIDGQQTLVENQNDAKKTDDYRALV